VGQFPIDRVPQKFAKLTEAEARQMQPVAIIPGQALEFNLMLNGSIVQATDRIIESERGLDHPDQVKVKVKSLGFTDMKINTKQFFYSELMKEVDRQSVQTQNGLTCYRVKEAYEHRRCFGQSTNHLISGFEIHIPANKNQTIYAGYREINYGGIELNWIIDQKNIAQAQKVDEAIWRVLDTWNISPLNQPRSNSINLK
jgi:hypothetical protein